jgi:hypothetical protein
MHVEVVGREEVGNNVVAILRSGEPDPLGLDRNVLCEVTGVARETRLREIVVLHFVIL